MIVLAVKPQALDSILAGLPALCRACHVSLDRRGKTLAALARGLGPDAAIIAHAEYAGGDRPRHYRCLHQCACQQGGTRFAAKLLAGGELAWVEDESLLDPVTAVSGSGPAYVFLLIESLAEAGVAAGLPAALAEKLARATVPVRASWRGSPPRAPPACARLSPARAHDAQHSTC